MKKIWYCTLLLFTACLMGCENTDKLESDLKALGERITALEGKVELLNGNIKALNILCQDGMIVSKVDHTDGVYTITLSDGTSLKLAEKTEGFGSAPLISINDAGQWVVSYDNGTTYTPLLLGNAPVNAVGKDGVTPAFRISAEGYWEVSANGGTTYAPVLDANGKPVLAVYDSAAAPPIKNFESITEENGVLKVKFTDGSEVKVPIVPDFYCYFDQTITGEQKINPGETKTFNIHLKGADNTIVTAPTGWKATLEAPVADVAVLTVTAPEGKLVTRAVADNTRDIAVLALKSGFATLTKIQVNAIDVEMGGGGETPVPAFIIPLVGDIDLYDIGNSNPIDNALTKDMDAWCIRRSITADTSFKLLDDTYNGKNVKAIEITAGETIGWYQMAACFYKKNANCDITKNYRLTFAVKGVEATELKYIIRVKGANGTFAPLKQDGTPTNSVISTIKIPAGQSKTWVSVSMDYTLSMKQSGNPGSTALVDATSEDASSLDFRFYHGTKSTTFSITDVKFEEIAITN